MSKNKKKGASSIPKSASKNHTETTYINRNVSTLNSWQQEGNKATVFVSLRYVQEDFQCFSKWNEDEMKHFWSFNRRIHDYSWQQVLEQGGKPGQKVGFGYTIIPRDKYPSKAFIDQFSPDATFFELRANDTIRLHGFRDKSIFYICWLDRAHEICK